MVNVVFSTGNRETVHETLAIVDWDYVPRIGEAVTGPGTEHDQSIDWVVKDVVYATDDKWQPMRVFVFVEKAPSRTMARRKISGI